MELIDSRFIAFVGVSAFLIVTPGPDMALVTRNALAGGGRAAAFTAFGVGLGILAWAVAVALGVAGVLDRSVIAFTVLKRRAPPTSLCLACAPCWAARAQTAMKAPARVSAVVSGPGRSLRQGALGNLLNPKAGVIFVSILPQFVLPGDPLPRLLAMLIAFEVMIVGWLIGYGALSAASAAAVWGRRCGAGCSG